MYISVCISYVRCSAKKLQCLCEDKVEMSDPKCNRVREFNRRDSSISRVLVREHDNESVVDE